MKKRTKFFMLLSVSAMCAMALTTAAACTKKEDKSVEVPDRVSGEVHVLLDGKPGSDLGADGDLCFTAGSGKIYRKTQSEWVETEFEEYTFENGKLSVTYPSGETGLFSVQETPEGTDAHEHTFHSEPVVIYESHCIVPGIGVNTCETCNESFAVILPAVPDNHIIDEDNFGKCNLCGKLQSGIAGAEVTNDTVEEAFKQLEDGDTVVLQEEVSLKPDSNLDIGEKDITIDMQGNDFTVNKTAKDTIGYGANFSVDAGGSLTITDSSTEENKGAINVSIPEGAGNFNTRSNDFFLRAKGAKENRAELNFENVTFNINDEDTMNVLMRTDYTDVTLGEGTVLNVDGVGYSMAMYANNGSTLTIDGAEINTTGDVTPFLVGGREAAATLNFESGKINMENPSDRMFGIQVNPGGHVNMTGGEINITGDLRSSMDDGVDVAVAIGVDNSTYLVDTTIDITGGKINLAPSYGTAYGVVAWPGNPVINISGMTINCEAHDADESGQGGYVFALCCSIAYGDIFPQMYLGDGLDIKLDLTTGRNMLFSTRENGGDGRAPDWGGSGDNIFDKTTDHKFSEEHAEEYDGQYVQSYRSE